MTDLAIDADVLLRHYDRLTATEVVQGLSHLGADGVSRVKEREMAGKNRTTVLRRIAALEGSPPPQARPRSTPGTVVIPETTDDSAAKETLPPAPPTAALAPGEMPAWARPAEPAAGAPGYAHAGAPPLPPQEVARLHQIAAVRSKATKSVAFWSVAVVVAMVVSVATFLNAGAGDTYFVWWGPVVFGIWRIFSGATVLFRLRNL